MSLITRFPLRWTIPVFLLLIAIITEGFTIIYSQYLGDAEEEKTGFSVVAQDMTELQASISGNMRSGDWDKIHSSIAMRGSNPNIALVALVDDIGTIIDSTNLKIVGASVTKVFPDINTSVLNEIDTTQTGRVFLSANRQFITGYYPIILGMRNGDLRPHRTGLIYLNYDLSYAKAIRRYGFERRALLMAGFYTGIFLLLGFVLHMVLTKRVNQLVSAARQVAKGDYSVQPALEGEDEIAQIGWAFDKMAKDIAYSQDALQNAASEYRSLIWKVQTAIVLHDGKGTILDSNPMAHKLLGLSKEQLLGKPLADPQWHFLKEDGSVLLVPEYPVSQVLSTRKPLRGYVFGIRRPEHDDIAWVLVNAEPEFDDHGEIHLVITSFVDISERKQTEEALKVSEERYHILIEQASDGIFLANPDGRYVEVNSAGCRLLGYTREEILNLTMRDLTKLTPERPLRLDELRAGKVLLSEREMIHKNGTLIPVEISAKQFPDGRFQGIVRDITERKRAEYALKETQTRLAEAQRLAQIGSWDWDALKDTIWWSEEYYKIYGIDPKLPTPTYAEHIKVYTQESVERLDSAVKKTMETGGSYEVDLELAQPTAETRWIVARGEAKRDANGKIWGLRGTAQNITERRQAEEEIRKLNQELEHRVANRTSQLEAANKELEAFAYSVSHDLRAPLRHIDGFATLLEKDSKASLNEKGKHYLDAISQSAHKMNSLIEDLLSFSRTGRAPIQSTTVNLNNLIQEVIKDLELDTANRNIEWKILALPEVKADLPLMRQAIYNLIANAVKFTRKTDKAVIEIGFKQTEAELTIYIRDNGVGFDMKQADHLFGVFQRLHNEQEFEGTGIGLANVKRIITRHGGKVWAEAEINKGATFYILLPK